MYKMGWKVTQDSKLQVEDGRKTKHKQLLAAYCFHLNADAEKRGDEKRYYVVEV